MPSENISRKIQKGNIGLKFVKFFRFRREQAKRCLNQAALQKMSSLFQFKFNLLPLQASTIRRYGIIFTQSYNGLILNCFTNKFIISSVSWDIFHSYFLKTLFRNPPESHERGKSTLPANLPELKSINIPTHLEKFLLIKLPKPVIF